MTTREWLEAQHVEAQHVEGLALLRSGNKSDGGYRGVHLKTKSKHSKPYQARVRRSGVQVNLGSFATAKEAALCVARSPEGQAAAGRDALAAPPLKSEEALQQAQAEGLTLRVAKSTTGFYGVSFNPACRSKPYLTQLTRGGKKIHLGSFATAEEAALCVARSPAGQVAARRRRAAAAPAPLASDDGAGDRASEEKETDEDEKDEEEENRDEETIEVLDAIEVDPCGHVTDSL